MGSKQFRFAPMIVLARFALDATSPGADEVTPETLVFLGARVFLSRFSFASRSLTISETSSNILFGSCSLAARSQSFIQRSLSFPIIRAPPACKVLGQK